MKWKRNKKEIEKENAKENDPGKLEINQNLINLNTLYTVTELTSHQAFPPS